MIVPLLSMEGQQALGFHQKYLNLCSKDEQRSYRFETTWGSEINDRIFIFGWIITFKTFKTVALLDDPQLCVCVWWLFMSPLFVLFDSLTAHCSSEKSSRSQKFFNKKNNKLSDLKCTCHESGLWTSVHSPPEVTRSPHWLLHYTTVTQHTGLHFPSSIALST